MNLCVQSQAGLPFLLTLGRSPNISLPLMLYLQVGEVSTLRELPI